MAQQNAVQIENLTVRFGRQVVLPQLSVSLPAGQIIGLLGPSGSGKTTLVKSILGLNQFQQGRIAVFDKPVPSLEALSLLGYMAQSDALYEDLSALDNLLFFGRLYGLRGKQAKTRAQELLAFVDLGQEGNKAVRYFSGGMKRRLSLAIALIHRPRLLILDEPTVGIDPVLRQKFWAEFHTLKEQGCTILATTHVMDEAVRCERILLLREGKLLANGTPEDLLCQTGAQNMEDVFLHFSGFVDKEAKEDARI